MTSKLLRSQDGVALSMAMVLMLVTLLLSITFRTLGAVAPQLAKNHADGVRARALDMSSVVIAGPPQVTRTTPHLARGGTMTVPSP